MDLLLVAAAAGAGYIAKNLQNVAVDKKENLWEQSFKYSTNVEPSSGNFLQQIRYQTCPLRRLEKTGLQDDNEGGVNFSTIGGLDKRDSAADVDSTGTSVSGREIPDDGERSFNRSNNKSRFVQGRRRGLNSVRPLISLENYVDSEVTMEQSLFSKIPPMSTVGPLLIIDGAGMNRSSSASSLLQFDGGGEERRRENGVGSKERNRMLRTNSLEQIDLAQLQRKPKKKSTLARMTGSSDREEEKPLNPPGPEGMLLFIMGMTVGIFSASNVSKREVDSLNKQLKQTQTLVQDLHEELDMREMLTVREIADEGYHQPFVDNDKKISPKDPISSPCDKEVKISTMPDNPEVGNKSNNIKLMSKIEEELQAELEMLEHTMNASVLKTISDVVELDPDFEPEFAQGDLKPKIVKENRENSSESGNKSTDTTTDYSQPANYAVNPWELSFRLHELIESRLEDRIKGLEVVLTRRQKRGHILGSRRNISGTRLSYSETESSCSPQSPIFVCGHDTVDGSLTNNFSRNSMVSKRESGEILLKALNNDETRDGGKFRSIGMDYEEQLSVKKMIDDLFDGEKKPIPCQTVKEGDRASEDLVQDVSRTSCVLSSRSVVLDEDFESDCDEGTDDSEMLLIKRIVERRKSGSTFYFNFDE